MYANFIPTRWAPDPVRNGVITLTNGFINGVAGVISPRNQWSDMGPYLQLMTGPNLASIRKGKFRDHTRKKDPWYLAAVI